MYFMLVHIIDPNITQRDITQDQGVNQGRILFKTMV